MSDDRYTMKIPRDLKDFLQKYIIENPEVASDLLENIKSIFIITDDEILSQ